MLHRRVVAFFVLASSALAGNAAAQGPVQLALSGEIDRTGGARAEVEVTFASSSGSAATARFSMFLAERTSAADLGVLLERRLGAAGVRVLNASSGQSARPITSLFFEDVLAIGMRLGNGLRSTVTLGEDRPDSVRILPPEDAKQDAELRVTASAWMAHERRHQRVELEARLEAAAPVVRIADLLVGASTRGGWASDMRNHEAWLPGPAAAGGVVDAVNFDLQTSGDWRLEIALVPRTQAR